MDVSVNHDGLPNEVSEEADFDNRGTLKRRKYARGRGGLCSKCQLILAQPKNRYCLKCHAAHMRAWRKTHPMSPEQRYKDTARSIANVYLKRGKLKQEPCTVCGDEKSQMHHPDYSKPLLVQWLCRKHHLELHARLRKPTEKQLQKVQMEQRKRRAA